MSDPSHVGRDEASRIAALARLRFEADELGRITEDLNHILDHVEELRSLEHRTVDGGLDGARRSTRGAEAERPDELRRDIPSFAPDWRDGFFVVPPFPGVHQEDDR